eukprot:1984056-Pleurochrysis_carterae.AAC.3
MMHSSCWKRRCCSCGVRATQVAGTVSRTNSMVRRSATAKQSVGRRSAGTRLAKNLQRRLRCARSACSINHTCTFVTDPFGLVFDKRILVVRVAGGGGIGAKAPVCEELQGGSAAMLDRCSTARSTKTPHCRDGG